MAQSSKTMTHGAWPAPCLTLLLALVLLTPTLPADAAYPPSHTTPSAMDNLEIEDIHTVPAEIDPRHFMEAKVVVRIRNKGTTYVREAIDLTVTASEPLTKTWILTYRVAAQLDLAPQATVSLVASQPDGGKGFAPNGSVINTGYALNGITGNFYLNAQAGITHALVPYTDFRPDLYLLYIPWKAGRFTYTYAPVVPSPPPAPKVQATLTAITPITLTSSTGMARGTRQELEFQLQLMPATGLIPRKPTTSPSVNNPFTALPASNCTHDTFLIGDLSFADMSKAPPYFQDPGFSTAIALPAGGSLSTTTGTPVRLRFPLNDLIPGQWKLELWTAGCTAASTKDTLVQVLEFTYPLPPPAAVATPPPAPVATTTAADWDFAIQSATIEPDSPVENQPFTIRVTIVNGAQAISQPLELQLEYPARTNEQLSSVAGERRMKLARSQRLSLPSADTGAVQTIAATAEGLAPGEYELMPVLNVLGLGKEPNVSNNHFNLRFTVLPAGGGVMKRR